MMGNDLLWLCTFFRVGRPIQMKSRRNEGQGRLGARGEGGWAVAGSLSEKCEVFHEVMSHVHGTDEHVLA